MRGENDFVTEECAAKWDGVFSRTERFVMEGCGHHGLNEKKEAYLAQIERWLAAND